MIEGRGQEEGGLRAFAEMDSVLGSSVSSGGQGEHWALRLPWPGKKLWSCLVVRQILASSGQQDGALKHRVLDLGLVLTHCSKWMTCPLGPGGLTGCLGSCLHSNLICLLSSTVLAFKDSFSQRLLRLYETKDVKDLALRKPRKHYALYPLGTRITMAFTPS